VTAALRNAGIEQILITADPIFNNELYLIGPSRMIHLIGRRQRFGVSNFQRVTANSCRKLFGQSCLQQLGSRPFEKPQRPPSSPIRESPDWDQGKRW